jgi:rubredoxin
MAEWVCSVCGYVYDEKSGDDENGVPAGTVFANIHPGWTCPVCRAGKEAFRPRAAADEPAREGTTVSDIMAAELVAWGVTVVFGLPGTSSLGLVEAIRKNPKIQYIVVRHEANAAMAASAYNKLTGKIAACLTIAGPGQPTLQRPVRCKGRPRVRSLAQRAGGDTISGAGGVQENRPGRVLPAHRGVQ